MIHAMTGITQHVSSKLPAAQAVMRLVVLLLEHGLQHFLTHFFEKKRKDYTFPRQFNEKPSITPGCPVHFFALRCMFIAHALAAQMQQ